MSMSDPFDPSNSSIVYYVAPRFIRNRQNLFVGGGTKGQTLVAAGVTQKAIWQTISEAPPTGPLGPQGISGTTGPSGVAGQVGPQGSAGSMGPQGIIGNTGPQGSTGSAGLQGFGGTQGSIGSQGVQGSGGSASGLVGLVGPQGTNGTVGPMGLTGPQGSQGSAGPQGSQGSGGAQGGVVGAQGTQGSQGSQGLPGSGGIAPVLIVRDFWFNTNKDNGFYCNASYGYSYTGAVVSYDNSGFYVSVASVSNQYNCGTQPSGTYMIAYTMYATNNGGSYTLLEATSNTTIVGSHNLLYSSGNEQKIRIRAFFQFPTTATMTLQWTNAGTGAVSISDGFELYRISNSQ
ncbi:unnamed protein product [Sphagnum jensenii]|uniref:Uncharacterized protein n=2 Tax=Sphagnum jensenii TaxID=128206 RepID=A0ABP0VHJ1_9BRYO